MAEYIEREAAIAVIEEKQKELCPLGRYSRTMVYGSDRDRFDSWQEMINSIEDIPTADVVEVRHGRWVDSEEDGHPSICCVCNYPVDRFYKTKYCPNCGAKMDGVVNDG